MFSHESNSPFLSAQHRVADTFGCSNTEAPLDFSAVITNCCPSVDALSWLPHSAAVCSIHAESSRHCTATCTLTHMLSLLLTFAVCLDNWPSSTIVRISHHRNHHCVGLFEFDATSLILDEPLLSKTCPAIRLRRRFLLAILPFAARASNAQTHIHSGTAGCSPPRLHPSQQPSSSPHSSRAAS